MASASTLSPGMSPNAPAGITTGGLHGGPPARSSTSPGVYPQPPSEGEPGARETKAGKPPGTVSIPSMPSQAGGPQPGGPGTSPAAAAGKATTGAANPGGDATRMSPAPAAS